MVFSMYSKAENEVTLQVRKGEEKAMKLIMAKLPKVTVE